MKQKLLKSALVLGVASAALMGAPAMAKHGQSVEGSSVFAKERFQVRVRAIGVLPDDGGHTTIGGTPEADNAFVPEVDLTYFISDHFALELIAATAEHDLALKGSTLGDLDLGDGTLLPPTLTLQYHPMPMNAFSPYIGAGINYTFVYGEDPGVSTTSLDAEDDFGFALQVGADYWINESWGLNVDVKKLWLDVDANVNFGTITGEVELDPWIVGVGVSYRF